MNYQEMHVFFRSLGGLMEGVANAGTVDLVARHMEDERGQDARHCELAAWTVLLFFLQAAVANGTAISAERFKAIQARYQLRVSVIQPPTIPKPPK